MEKIEEKHNQINIKGKSKEAENMKKIIKINQEDDEEFGQPCGKSSIIEKTGIGKGSKSQCHKCKVNKPSYYVRMEFICKACFIKVSDHKFRCNLRAHCRIRHEDNLLVCLSGGVNSMLALHLFNLSLNDSTSSKKMFFKIKFLFIDDSFFFTNFVTNKNSEKLIEERQKNEAFLSELSQKYQFEIQIVNFEYVLDLNSIGNSQTSKSTNFDLVSNLCSNIDLFTDPSFKIEYTSILRQNLISHFALKNQFNKVVMCNTQTNQVNSIFSDIVLGRGNKINLGYVDNSLFGEKLQFLRPMKDYLSKEIYILSHIYNLKILSSSSGNVNRINNKCVSKPCKGNAFLLIENFLDKLQDKMFATTPTIVSTVDKIDFAKQSSTSKCTFCYGIKDGVANLLEIGTYEMLNQPR